MKRLIVLLIVLLSQQPMRTPKTVWAFFYAWYKDSGDPAVMERQIRQAQSAGITGFISSWWGPHDATDNNLATLLEVAKPLNFGVALHFETLTDGKPRQPHQIEDWLDYALSHYGKRLARVRGKPLVAIYAAETVHLSVWQTIFNDLRARGLDATYLAMGYNAADLTVFDGTYQYGIFWVPNLPGTEALMSQQAHEAGKLFAATIQPGYDERGIPGRRGDYQDRLDGAYYRSTMEAALDSDPDLTFITTWNEWYEHSAIEPGEPFGDQYLKLTRQFVDSWNAR